MERTVKDIALSVDGQVVGDGEILIRGVNALEASSPGEISFFINPKYEESLKSTKASAVIVREVTRFYGGAQVVVEHPSLAYVKIATLFAPPLSRFPGVSERAVIHETSRIGKGASIYPGVYVGRETVIGEEVTLFPGVYLGDRVKIGDRVVIYPNVAILHDSMIGNDVIIHAGTVIGGDGFGFVRDRAVSVKIPQTGFVQIDDHVELGACNCVDRATHGKTWIQKGVKTDNLVHVGHNCTVGENTVIVAQTGIAGSTRIGKEVVIGGNTAINDHIEIGDRAMIGSMAGVPKSIPPSGIVSGIPAMPHRLWLKVTGLTKRLPQIHERLGELEKRMDSLAKVMKRE